MSHPVFSNSTNDIIVKTFLINNRHLKKKSGFKIVLSITYRKSDVLEPCRCKLYANKVFYL